jgi:hypothetical protein
MRYESTDYMQELEDDEVDQPPSDELNDYLQFCLTRNSSAPALSVLSLIRQRLWCRSQPCSQLIFSNGGVNIRINSTNWLNWPVRYSVFQLAVRPVSVRSVQLDK